jgi:pimeloyl-ACP methyl ester carboxylesterase
MTVSATTSPAPSASAVSSTHMVSAANGVDYAYRQSGGGEPPLVLLQHFRGDLDNWDPALIDALAAHRRVITFDNVGVGRSWGSTPGTVAYPEAAHGFLFQHHARFAAEVSGFLAPGTDGH